MLKPIKFLIKKIIKYNPMMIAIMIVYTILATIQPFIWILVPAKVIDLGNMGDVSNIIKYVLAGGILSFISVVVLSFLTGNYRMRMNSVRYALIRDLMVYTLTMPYEGMLDTKVMANIKLGDNAVRYPREGAGGIILVSLSLFGNIFASLGLLGLMATLSPFVMVFLFVLVLLSFYFRNKANDYEAGRWDESAELERRYYKTTEIMAEPEYGKDIRIYSLIDIMSSYCDSTLSSFEKILKSIRNKYVKVEFIEGVLNILRDSVVFAYISYLLLNNRIEVSEFFLYTTGTISLVSLLQEMMRQIAEITKESKRLNGYIDLIENQVLVKDEENIYIRQKLMDSPLKIEIKNVSFRYPNSEKDILDNISLTINAGEKLALVGENGAGKSTLIKILCKLYKPTSGNIYINGMDMNEIPEYVYWDAVGAVFQDAIVFPFSVKENILMGDEINSQVLENAIEESSLKEIIDKLPKGMDTTLLRTLDDEGIDISGGQRQKLYLARAIYKENRFLMLDEPTAALDPLAEAELYEKYSMLSKNKTSLYISHRLASTKFCDRIAYLQDGKIIELGSHNELMALGGEYNKIFNIQSKYYKNSYEMEEVTDEI